MRTLESTAEMRIKLKKQILPLIYHRGTRRHSEETKSLALQRVLIFFFPDKFLGEYAKFHRRDVSFAGRQNIIQVFQSLYEIFDTEPKIFGKVQFFFCPKLRKFSKIWKNF